MPEKAEKTHKCYICGKVVSNASNMWCHKKTTHKNMLCIPAMCRHHLHQKGESSSTASGEPGGAYFTKEAKAVEPAAVELELHHTSTISEEEER